MTLSTEGNQTAVGTGDLIKSGVQQKGIISDTTRNIPFRFAFSSAVYQIQKVNYKGTLISILFRMQNSPCIIASRILGKYRGKSKVGFKEFPKQQPVP